MAFVKLFPPEGGDALPVADVIRRLEDEFAVVDADPDQGHDHVADMIAATLWFSDAVPGKQERLAWFQSVQDGAVYVYFGDEPNTMAGCCVMPDSVLRQPGRGGRTGTTADRTGCHRARLYRVRRVSRTRLRNMLLPAQAEGVGLAVWRQEVLR